MKTSANLNLWSQVFLKAVFLACYSSFFIQLICGMILKIKLLHMLTTQLCMLKLNYIRNIASSIAQKNSPIRKCYKTFGNNDAVLKYFYAFILPCFEYCSPVWSSVFDLHLKLLDRDLNNIRFFLLDILIDLENVEI